MKKLGLVIILVPFLNACLMTRSEIYETSAPTEEQILRADETTRYQELDGRMRLLYGRIEVLENSVSMVTAEREGSRIEREEERAQLNRQLEIYEEALKKLEEQHNALAQKVSTLQASVAASATRTAAQPASGGGNQTSWQAAEQEFGKKSWQSAIVGYQRYRDLNPNGRNYAEATYKIGVSFQELGMKAEARAFYSEVIEKFPNTKMAENASYRLRNL